MTPVIIYKWIGGWNVPSDKVVYILNPNSKCGNIIIINAFRKYGILEKHYLVLFLSNTDGESSNKRGCV